MKRFSVLGPLLVSLAGLYFLYVITVAFFLNTPLFESVTHLSNEELTHIRIHGAISFFPGYLQVANMKVGIRDQNVSIDIFLKNSRLKFDLLPLFKKTLHISDLHVADAEVDVGLKSADEKMRFIHCYTEEKSYNLPLRVELGKKNRETHLKLEIPHLRIDRISKIETPAGELKAEAELHGGFRIQPGADVEVFPTLLTIQNGSLTHQHTDQMEKVNLVALVQFNPFFIPDAPGNAVFPYVNADITFSAHAYAMELLDLTLRSLPHYRFVGEKSNLRSRLLIQRGKLQIGSFFETEPAAIGVHSPDIEAKGSGQAKWITSENHSDLTLQVANVDVKAGDSPQTIAKTSNTSLHLTLYGNDLVHLFHGLIADLEFQGLQWKLDNSRLSRGGVIHGNGRLLGIAGEVDNSLRTFWSGKHTRFDLALDALQFTPEDFPLVSINGKFSAFAKPIDFKVNSILFDKVDTTFSVKVGDHEQTHASLKMHDMSYLLAPHQSWKGHLYLLVDDTAPFVHALHDRKKISDLAALFANVSNLTSDIEWEMGGDFSWFKVNSVHSSGMWTAYGTLMDKGAGLNGLFEVKVAGLPVGVRIEADKTNVTFLPSKDWYNAGSETHLRRVAR